LQLFLKSRLQSGLMWQYDEFLLEVGVKLIQGKALDQPYIP